MQLIKCVQVFFIALFLMSRNEIFACHPECTSADGLVSRSMCTPVCEPTVCNATPSSCAVPKCTIRCEPDACESDNCPMCETVCEQPEPGCSIECGITQCSWKCYGPVALNPNINFTCNAPTCELLKSSSLFHSKKECNQSQSGSKNHYAL